MPDHVNYSISRNARLGRLFSRALFPYYLTAFAWDEDDAVWLFAW